MKRPLIIVSGLRQEEADFVLPLLKEIERPLYLEGTSRLRGHPDLARFELKGGEKILKRAEFDGVIRIGNVPTLRFWRDLENSRLPVLNFSNIPLSGLPRVGWVQPLIELAELQMKYLAWTETERQFDLKLHKELVQLVLEYPLSEPGWFQTLSRWIPVEARLFLGNSLPIREWDTAAEFNSTRDIFANRGTNGIDGLVATFCGVCERDRSNWAIVGDLSVLYDLSGPWSLRERPIEDFNLVIINNGGGQIFQRMFQNTLFLNSHDLHFENWAKMFSLGYERITEAASLGETRGPRVVEIIPCVEQTEAYWSAWEKL
jgi:2-succinyl-5-enolpyruvyl-6-hydroxy-3-cyclohexene-1-carboxylate synthase